MGCCVSTTTKSSNTDNHQSPLTESCKAGGAPLASPPPPPQAPVEEETVKEVVLSETPMPKPPTSDVLESMKKNSRDSEIQELETESTAGIKLESESTALSEPKSDSTAGTKPSEEIVCEVSDHSEMLGLTESLSTATASEKIDDDGEVTQKPPERIPRRRKKFAEKERGVRSPARRPATTPERRGQMGPARAGQGRPLTTQRRNVGTEKSVRRDSGEGSGRRWGSPATRGEVGMRQSGTNKSPTLSETGRPGGRSPARNVDNGHVEEKSNDDVSAETSETLENPVVSLECFIFL